MNKYRFIDTQKATFPIRDLCRVLSVPESSYFDWNLTGRANHERRSAAKSRARSEDS